jgi:hypothetical protein
MIPSAISSLRVLPKSNTKLAKRRQTGEKAHLLRWSIEGLAPSCLGKPKQFTRVPRPHKREVHSALHLDFLVGLT